VKHKRVIARGSAHSALLTDFASRDVTVLAAGAGIGRPDMRVKHCAYGRSIALQQFPTSTV
jgi:hypothetical protein